MSVTALFVHGETGEHVGLRRRLEDRGLLVAEVDTGLRALALAELDQPALVIVESALPDMSGFEVCRRIAQMSGTPTLLIGEDAEWGSNQQGGGPTASLSAPCSSEDVAARAERLLATPQMYAPEEAIAVRTGRLLELGDVTVDLQTNRVTVASRQMKLLPTQVNLLRALVERSPRVTSPAALAKRIWPRGGWDFSSLADVIMELRLCLEDEPDEPTRLVYVADYGYRINPVWDSHHARPPAI